MWAISIDTLKLVYPASDVKQLSTKALTRFFIFRDRESFRSFGMAVAGWGHSIMHDLFVMSVLFRSPATDERSGWVLGGKEQYRLERPWNSHYLLILCVSYRVDSNMGFYHRLLIVHFRSCDITVYQLKSPQMTTNLFQLPLAYRLVNCFPKIQKATVENYLTGPHWINFSFLIGVG